MQDLIIDKRSLAEKLLLYEGKKLDFEEFFFWPVLWQLERSLKRVDINRVILAGRQVGKSSFMAFDPMIESLSSNFRALYVAPQESQAKTYSVTRLGNMLKSPNITKLLYSRNSPLISALEKEARPPVKNDVYQKMFINGSYINISFAADDPSRIRGFSADSLLFDESSLMALSEIEPIVSFSLRSSRDPRSIICGTPLAQDELSALYEQSMQITYTVPCSCGNWQELDNLDIIDIKRRALICPKCGKILDTRLGKFHINNKKSDIIGMRINMLMLPSLMDPECLTWQLIKKTLSSPITSEDQKKQELLGISSGEGDRLISDVDLDALPRIESQPGTLQDSLEYIPYQAPGLIMGIDWGGGTIDEGTHKSFLKSHTSVTLTAVKTNPQGDRLEQHILFNKLYPLEDPNRTLEDIKQIILKVSHKLLAICSDAGGGNFVNPILNNFLIQSGLIHIQFYTVEMLHLLGDKLRMNKNIVQVEKRQLITEYFRKIKLKEIKLFKGDHTHWYNAVLSQRIIIDSRGNRMWKRAGLISDDLLFSSLFAYLGGLFIFRMESEFTRPM